MKIGLRKFEILLLVFVILFMVPVVANFMGFRMYPVISNSMFHWSGGPVDDPEFYEENYYAMWESEGYSRDEVENFPLPNGFDVGDYIISVKADNFSIGDVVVWERSSRGQVVTHRLIRDNGSLLGIIGDYTRVYNENYTEHFANISAIVEFALKWVDREEVQEKVISVIPKIGVPYLFFSCLQNRYCGLPCFFNSTCLQNSFGVA